MGHQNVRINGSSAIIDATATVYSAGAATASALLVDVTLLSGALRVGDGTGVLESLVITDESTQNAAFDVYLLELSTSLGTLNSAPSMSAANSRLNFLGHISVGAGDWKNLGNFSVAAYQGLSIVLKANPGSKDIYFAVVNGTGTPTYGANALRFRAGILQD